MFYSVSVDTFPYNMKEEQSDGARVNLDLDAAFFAMWCVECRLRSGRGNALSETRHLPRPDASGEVMGWDLPAANHGSCSREWTLLATNSSRETWTQTKLVYRRYKVLCISGRSNMTSCRFVGRIMVVRSRTSCRMLPNMPSRRRRGTSRPATLNRTVWLRDTT